MDKQFEHVKFTVNAPLSDSAIIDVFKSSIIIRPVHDKERIKTMFQNANLLVGAWLEDELVGLSRALTDFSYCCYLSDLAVKKEYQKMGVGKRLVEITKERVGDRTMLLLLAAPKAIAYYPKIGLEKVENCFMIKRTS